VTGRPVAAGLPGLAGELAAVVSEVMAEFRPRLTGAAITGRRGEQVNARHAGNFLSDHDLRMHQRYRDLLSARLGSFVYASEEADPAIIGSDADPDLCVLVDPLDTSELAVRALCGYTHVLAWSRSLGAPVAAVVGDIFHYVRLYAAVRQADGTDRAVLVTADGDHVPLSLAGREPVPLREALVTNYLMRPAERFGPLAAQHQLLAALGEPGPGEGRPGGRIGVDFGSVGLCHVAAGFTDAMVEFAKGFAVWDLAPGHYVLRAAGGTVTTLDGCPLPLDYGFATLDGIAAAMNRRQKFIAAGSTSLARDLAATLA
jgi:myo-inositol-1(or 4)-monophosphatase